MFEKATFGPKLCYIFVYSIQKMTAITHLSDIINQEKDPILVQIAEKVNQQKRISNAEGLYLFQHASLSYLGILANYIKEQKGLF